MLPRYVFPPEDPQDRAAPAADINRMHDHHERKVRGRNLKEAFWD
jgi:hypothetical protein